MKKIICTTYLVGVLVAVLAQNVYSSDPALSTEAYSVESQIAHRKEKVDIIGTAKSDVDVDKLKATNTGESSLDIKPGSMSLAPNCSTSGYELLKTYTFSGESTDYEYKVFVPCGTAHLYVEASGTKEKADQERCKDSGDLISNTIMSNEPRIRRLRVSYADVCLNSKGAGLHYFVSTNHNLMETRINIANSETLASCSDDTPCELEVNTAYQEIGLPPHEYDPDVIAGVCYRLDPTLTIAGDQHNSQARSQCDMLQLANLCACSGDGTQRTGGGLFSVNDGFTSESAF